jgi:hypothetical protein
MRRRFIIINLLLISFYRRGREAGRRVERRG